jgi:hydrogenase maturation protein HypF
VMQRRRLLVRGVVQGVGFRPFVYRLAKESQLTGFVLNHADGVTIEVEGEFETLDQFCRKLESSPPPLSRITDLRQEDISAVADESFKIHASAEGGAATTMVPPDIAVCDDCLREMCNPLDRRYRYPFLNCTNCGPRYTITSAIPYDRPQTTMRDFPMCPECRGEYDDPLDRRFHAQPTACPVCGPHVTLQQKNQKNVEGDDAIRNAVTLLEEGAIVAVRALGGYQLLCNAGDEHAVCELRRRKRRYEKPLAVMAADCDRVREFADINDQDVDALECPERPIVLVQRLEQTVLARSLAPGQSTVGAMLPCTPLHYLLLEADVLALVATSGNMSEEPIAIDNADALKRLESVADAFLMHNRDINTRCDDSVVRRIAGKIRPIRRARGYAPLAVPLAFKPPSILACGADLKNSVCLTRGRDAYLSQYIGDQENRLSREFFAETVGHLENILEVKPELFVHDLQPDFASTRYAIERAGNGPQMGVQHHHAHIAAVMAEHGLEGPVIGIALDGTGMGTDSTVWGGELLLVEDWEVFTRVGHLRPLRLPGGDMAVRQPWRMAVSALYTTYGDDWPEVLPDYCRVEPQQLDVIGQLVKKGIQSPWSSGCGRVFDAVAALLGLRQVAGFEGQTGMELESLVPSDQELELPYETGIDTRNGVLILRTEDCIRSIMNDVAQGIEIPLIASRFHRTLIEMFAGAARLAARQHGITNVALSGGCFQNHILAEGLCNRLREMELTPWLPELTPVNDGGIAFGQAAIAAAIIA